MGISQKSTEEHAKFFTWRGTILQDMMDNKLDLSHLNVQRQQTVFWAVPTTGWTAGTCETTWSECCVHLVTLKYKLK